MQKLYQSINKILKVALRVSFLYRSYIECKGYVRREKRFCKLVKCFVYLSLENKRN